METADRNDLDARLTQARLALSVLALLARYLDPTDGGWLSIDRPTLIILILHLGYSLGSFLAVRYKIGIRLIPATCVGLDVAFATAVTVVTLGAPSASLMFFLFAILAAHCQMGFRAAMSVTVVSSLVYFVLLAILIFQNKHENLMRAGYLAITGYLLGFIGEQRARFEARLRQLETAAERQTIARALHDNYVQALAGVNLRLETCRRLVQSGNSEDTLAQLTDLQKGVAAEYDAVRAYIRSLAEIERLPPSSTGCPDIEPAIEVRISFAAPAPMVEQALQIAREGVRNTRKHARARSGSIDITGDGDRIRIVMQDDGIGFPDPAQPPWAIASRVAEYGGRLAIGGGDARGAHLEVVLPRAD